MELGTNPGLSQPCFEQPGHDLLIDMQGGSRQGQQLNITTQWKKITKNELQQFCYELPLSYMYYDNHILWFCYKIVMVSASVSPSPEPMSPS